MLFSLDLRLFTIAFILINLSFTLSSSSRNYKHAFRHSKHRFRREQDSTGETPSTIPKNSDFTIDGVNGTLEESGPWGPWVNQSKCTRSCGGGVFYFTRKCSQSGSDACKGPLKKYQSCNVQECPNGAANFRSTQCARFNTLPFEGRYYSWVPYNRAPNKCELNCMPRGERFYFRHAEKVIDGTVCYDDGRLDVCVDGICLPVGCDKKLGSTSVEDKCRECGGDGSKCKTINGVFDLDNLRVGYNDILLIPAGATNIHIKEMGPTNNYLAVRNLTGGYYLNGYWSIDFPRDKTFAGTLFKYQRKPHGFRAPESLQALGPTTEPIFISLLYQENNPGVMYEYSVPKDIAATHQESYTWEYDDFSECSATCGGGYQTRNVKCVQSTNKESVPDYLCDSSQQPAVNESCSAQPCPAVWEIQPWHECSKKCGEGVQFRNVFCQQIVYGGIYSLADDEECLKSQSDKPENMRPCSNNGTCPDWTVGSWKVCDAFCGEGQQTREVTCEQKSSDEMKTLDDSFCDDSERPASSQTCVNQLCEGVEWVVSEWNGCDSCGAQMETRVAKCANSDGEIYPDEHCTSSIPELIRECNGTATVCEYQWFASEWTECSAECGEGVQTREVFCGSMNNGSVEIVSDSDCDESNKYAESQNCTSAKCENVWFSGPWNRCSVNCGGGDRERKIMCIGDKCDMNMKPEDMDSCNIFSCDDDQVMVIDGCKKSQSKHGCCPDGMTPATGPNYKGCPEVEPGKVCEETEYGCCVDGVTAAFGPFRAGCPNYTHCNETKFGCCPDGIFSAKGNDSDGCEFNCQDTEFGCCSDGVTVAGVNMDGCDEMETPCNGTEYGCCLDGMTIALDVNGTNCDNATNCEETEFGCCPDDITTALDGDLSNCDNVTDCLNTTFGCCPGSMIVAIDANLTNCENITSCSASTFGCCPDEVSEADGPDFFGCLDEGSADILCVDSIYGCCLDGITLAGPNNTGCENITVPDCSETSFGCCPDGVESAKGEFYDGCILVNISCENTTYGCCSDNTSLAFGEDFLGCPGPCENSTFGCCPDDVTSAFGPNFERCPCENTTYGCCPDGITIAGPNNTGCENITIECSETDYGCCPHSSEAASGEFYEGCRVTNVTCEGTTYGCCDDNVSLAYGPEFLGCPGACENSTFGCCPDNETAAFGPNFERCIMECSNTTYGCCPDGISVAGPNNTDCDMIAMNCSETDYGCCPDDETAAIGEFYEGCILVNVSCENTTYGCCEDNVSLAYGDDYLGCPGPCENSTFGCCPDNKTAAFGPNYYNCEIPCSITEFGCCPDKKEAASGPKYEGCVIDCQSEAYTCCPDNKTLATGPDYGGCPCEMFEHGCCPDGIHYALGPRFLGCTCHYLEYKCCQDGYTPAEGPDYSGCTCDKVLFGCCPDNETPAKGPHYDGCSCHTMHFGCCQDNETMARGPNFQGCGCKTTPYGCCHDLITPAIGPNFQGCDCRQWEYGCCYDGVSHAVGPNFEGCDCRRSPYGCCPDGTTSAEGYNHKGCKCEFMPFGCCPDGVTAATGENYQGCGCIYSQYGCCPDNRTTAQGPENYGCGCNSMTYGCCLDGQTPAAGPNYEGCRCELQPFGCCHDGETMALGPNFEGCPVVKPSKSGVVCGLPKDTGSCRDFKVHWFFDSEYGGCSRFWYGGCDGNENRFQSQEECEQTCILPQGKDVCKLPLVKGTCDGGQPVWGYSYQTNACVTYTYGGCLGNNNKFQNKRECEAVCISDEPITDPCKMDRDPGPCNDKTQKYFYERNTRRCYSFEYGGCDGNSNNFDTIEQCEERCNVDVTPTREDCLLPKESGSCIEYQERWYFDIDTNDCRNFIYGGCKGNKNNFLNVGDCRATCSGVVPQVTPEPFKTEYCFLNYEVGPCTDSTIYWYYDYQAGICERFYFGGCDGNQNRFKSRAECEQKCGSSQDLCELPKMFGSCSRQFMQWHYDSSTDSCIEFFYTGCRGNKNRFNSIDECQQRCVKATTTVSPTPVTSAFPDTTPIVYNVTPTATPEPPLLTTVRPLTIDELCMLPKNVGSCSLSYEHYYFNAQSKKCELLEYTGCGGNANRFETLDNCKLYCERTSTNVTEPQSNDVCRLPVESGPCDEGLDRWHYDIQDSSCKKFSYGGCEGNKNNFESQEICENYCSSIKPVVCTNENSCNDIRCPYGIDEIVDIYGCRSCQCYNPCRGFDCNADERCVIEVDRTQSGEYSITPICRLDVKPGSCPVIRQDVEAARCIRQCNTDADCRSDRKCCSEGCSMLCKDPFQESITTTETPVTKGATKPTARIINPTNTLKIGESLTLQCEATGQPEPIVVWFKDLEQIVDDDDRLLQEESGSLRIIGADESDAGLYTCLAYNNLGQARAEVTLTIDKSGNIQTTPLPTTVLPTNETLTTVTNQTFTTVPPTAEGPQVPKIEPVESQLDVKIGSPVTIRCKATGNPPPRVVWYKGINVLNNDDSQYKVLLNGMLQIESVSRNDSDLYRCLAFNKHGRDIIAVQLNVEENVNVVIKQSPEPYLTGSNIQLDCILSGYPKPRFGWYFNSKPLSPSHNIQLLSNGTLILLNVTANHTGIYQCLGANSFSQKSTYVDIMIKSEAEKFPDCTDSPHFADCQRIIDGDFCNNKYYGKYCCRSCYNAGKINPSNFNFET